MTYQLLIIVLVFINLILAIKCYAMAKINEEQMRQLIEYDKQVGWFGSVEEDS